MNEVKRNMIEEICREKGIEMVDISYDWITILKKGNIEKKLINNNFYLNSRVSVELAKDKYSTYEVLKYYGIPMIEHKPLFNPEIMPNVEGINRDFEVLKNAEKQVIKASDSSQGKDVFVSQNEKEKIQIVKNLFQKEFGVVVVCPYVEIEFEYRAIVLDGEVIFLYKKQKPFVVGNGEWNVKRLIEHDLKYLTEPMTDLDLESIPKKGEKVTVGWKHNLSNGAIPLIVNQEDLYVEEVKKIALETGKAMEIKFASVDICVTKEKKICVMEVNSNVCISKFCELMPNGYEIGKNIYARVIDKMFEN